MAITFPTCWALMFVLLLLLDSAACNNRFENAKSCPANEEAWNNRAQKKSCQEPTPDFMCAAIENHPGRFGEICTIVGLSSAGQCAVLDADTYNLNFIVCSAPTGCPSTAYKASEVYKYPVCYNISFSISSTGPPSLTDTVTQNTNSVPTETIGIVTIVLFLFVFLALLLVAYMYMRRKKQADSQKHLEGVGLLGKSECKGDTAYTLKVSILGTYLKFRLVAVCDITDLRNKMRLHSKALKHNFEKDFQRIMQMTKEDDLKMLDLNIVYNLLVNFCEIPKPSRGRGYKPNDEDASQGADIERIRIILNDYLDNRYCDDEDAEVVIRRWTDRYGEINPSDAINLSRESKIDYLEVQPDCIVKCGIVVTEAIENIMEKIKLTDIVVCRGAIGCGKTTALDFVTKALKKEDWEIEWAEEFIDHSCFKRVLNSHKTVLCCDNYCGSYGCQMFSKDVLASNDHYIKKIISSEKEIKVLIGIHKHVYDEITSYISQRSFLQNTRFHVDLDNLSKIEFLWLYKLQEEKSTSKQNPVSFENLLAMTEKRSGMVGTAFQTMMMCSLPDTFLTKAFCNEPFQILTEHFKKLTDQNTPKFKSLLYIVCVMIFDLNAKELNPQVANALGIDFDIHLVKYYVKELAPYIKIDDNCVELKHELIAIAVFHTYLEVFRKPLSILNACDIRKILELARPEAEGPRCHPFAIPFSRPSFESVRGVLETRIKNENINTLGHPLIGYVFESK